MSPLAFCQAKLYGWTSIIYYCWTTVYIILVEKRLNIRLKMNLCTKPRQEVQCITINTITNQAVVKREIIVKGKNTYGRYRKLKPRSYIELLLKEILQKTMIKLHKGSLKRDTSLVLVNGIVLLLLLKGCSG